MRKSPFPGVPEPISIALAVWAAESAASSQGGYTSTRTHSTMYTARVQPGIGMYLESREGSSLLSECDGVYGMDSEVYYVDSSAEVQLSD